MAESVITWLHRVGSEFLQLSDSDRLTTLDHLISLCGSKELIHLYSVLPMLLYRDFLRLLPREISLKILSMLDGETVLNCCCVSKYWNNLLHSFGEVWWKLASIAGANVVASPSRTVHFYKQAFLKMRPLFGQMENKLAFDVMTLQGHKGRVMAITCDSNVIVTGSDDHTIRVWNINTGTCIQVLRAQSVSALHLKDKKVYAGSFDSSAACWELFTGALVSRYVGHTSAVFSLHSNREINLLVTGSADKTVKLWDLSSSELLQSFNVHDGWVISVKILTHSTVLCNSLKKSRVHLLTADKQHCIYWLLENLQTIEKYDLFGDIIKCIPFDTQGCGLDFYLLQGQDLSHTLNTYASDLDDNGYDENNFVINDLPQSLPPIQPVLGKGRKFAAFMVDTDYSRIVIVDLPACKIVCSIPVPPYRHSKNGATVTLGASDWLDGFTDYNRHGLFLATCLKDNDILVIKWKDR